MLQLFFYIIFSICLSWLGLKRFSFRCRIHLPSFCNSFVDSYGVFSIKLNMLLRCVFTIVHHIIQYSTLVPALFQPSSMSMDYNYSHFLRRHVHHIHFRLFALLHSFSISTFHFYLDKTKIQGRFFKLPLSVLVFILCIFSLYVKCKYWTEKIKM